MLSTREYYQSTRHPWSCFWFLLPLLIVYETGIIWLGGARPEALRNGADAWLRSILLELGLYDYYWAPVLVGVYFCIQSFFHFSDRPKDMVGVVTGMAIEAILFALGLWGVGQMMIPVFQRMGVPMNTGEVTAAQTIEQIVTFVGAGIYEEVLFRLLLFSVLAWSLRWALLTSFLSVPWAAVTSALLFSAAHHWGPQGEAYDGYIFLFRTAAGLYFTLIYMERGFAVAVGAHAVYDMLVGSAVI